MKGTLFQMYDRDGEPAGLLYTPVNNISTVDIEQKWAEWELENTAIPEDEDMGDLDNFVNWLNKKTDYMHDFERVFTEEVNVTI